MRMLAEPRRAAPVDCPYLPDRAFVQDYFFADGLDEAEFGVLLDAGWRRFGNFFFRPACPGCRLCIPLRLDAANLAPTRSQRRVLSRGRDVVMDAVPPNPTDEAWEVYRAHSEGQFGRRVHRAEFERTFFDQSVPSVQTEYRLDGILIGLGFLDLAADGASSVYFSFHPDWAKYSPGTLSVLMESAWIRRKGLRWYYLGYWVPGCDSMEYKARFVPHELLDWKTGAWVVPHLHPAVAVDADAETDAETVDGTADRTADALESRNTGGG